MFVRSMHRASVAAALALCGCAEFTGEVGDETEVSGEDDLETLEATSTVYLSDRTPSSATNGYGPYEKDRSNGESAAGDGRTIKLAGVSYSKGLGVHAGSDLRFPLTEGCSTFAAKIGVDDEVGSGGSGRGGALGHRLNLGPALPPAPHAVGFASPVIRGSRR